MDKIDSLIAEVKKIVEQSDEQTRKHAHDVFRDMQCELESPFELLMRIYDLNIQISLIRVGIDLRIFDTLCASSIPVTVDQFAAETKAAPELLGRILRYLASVRLIKEVDAGKFTANEATKTLGDYNYQGGVCLSFDVCGPSNQALPEYLKEKKYQNIVSNKDTAFHKAWKTDLPCFVWLRERPEYWNYLHRSLQVQHRGDWLTGFDVTPYVQDWNPVSSDAVLFVDVGGSMGAQCIGFRDKYPDLKSLGKIVLQDMKEAVDLVEPIPGVVIQAQDFYKPQQIHGAKFYYHRNIFHDYPDERCLQLLENLLPACSTESLILIDDKVLPDKGVDRYTAMLDMAMLAQPGSMERTRGQWISLLERGHCSILDIVTYGREHDSIIVVKPKTK